MTEEQLEEIKKRWQSEPAITDGLTFAQYLASKVAEARRDIPKLIEDNERLRSAAQGGFMDNSRPTDSVVQPWVSQGVQLKQQTVLLQSLRGNDLRYLPQTKLLQRWMRSKVYVNADPAHTFMGATLGEIDLAALDKELTYCTVHFAAHLSFGLEILAYNHPDEVTRHEALSMYQWIAVEVFHMIPETADCMAKRLKDQI